MECERYQKDILEQTGVIDWFILNLGVRRILLRRSIWRGVFE